MLIQLLLSISFATVLVKAPDANPHEFFIYAQNSESQKISSYLLQCKKSAEVYDQFKKAQFHFLNGSLTQAKDSFENIHSLRWACDWKEDERRVITFSQFRLAQMAEVAGEKEQMLQNALNFDESFSPDSTVFPPPLVLQYKKLKNQFFKKQIILPQQSAQFSSLLRNGKFFSLSDFNMEVATTKARFTWVSDTYKIITFVGTLEEFLLQPLEPQPYAQGSCKNPQPLEELKYFDEPVEIFYSADCQSASSKVNADLASSPSIAQPQRSSLAASINPSIDGLRGSNQFAPPPTQQKNWFQRNYIWIGATVIASALIYHNYQQNQESHQQSVVVPTSTFDPPPQ